MEVSCAAHTSASSIHFKPASLENVLPDAIAMVALHHEETGTMNHEEFDPDYQRYLAVEKSGLSRLFIVDDGEDLVGYSFFFVMPHMHYRKAIWAYQDVLFIKPAYRGTLSVEFVKWCDSQLFDEGVSRIVRSVHEKNDYSGLLKHVGYEPLETQFIRSA